MHQTMKMKIQLGKIWEFSTPIEKGPGSKSEDNETSVTKDTEMQIKHDEEVAIELQRQLLEKTTYHNNVAATGADLC